MGESIEVEVKYPLPMPERVLAQLAELNATWTGEVVQVDEYLAHPVRDFAKTDEAFRIRSVGPANCLTYKGPKLDSQTKTRREIEVAFAEGEIAREQMLALVLALGFKSVAQVHKIRRQGSLLFGNQEIVLALDRVQGAGEFLELEICTSPAGVAVAQQALFDLAAKLGLGTCERRSYLEICLAGQTQS